MNEKTKWGVVVGILALLVIALACSGCQALGGACRDLESAARYGHQHIVCEE